LAVSVADNLRAVRERIVRACAKAGRSEASVGLVAVSKTQSIEKIREAYEAGQRAFGENYVQELADKASALADLSDIEWHFIGHLQRNKVKQVAIARAFVESVDSIRLAAELDKRALDRTPVLAQVNVAGEAQKSGCDPSELAALVDALRESAKLELRGLMTIPPLSDDPEASRPYFARLRALAAEHSLREISMGMSADLEVAIDEGASLVRVGTAIFGARAG
jgi:PLP dependent protein